MIRPFSRLCLFYILACRVSAVTDPPDQELSADPNNIPSPTDAANANVAPNGKFQWQFWAKCSEYEKNTIKQAWEDSEQFADAFGSWRPTGDYQGAVDMYMGTRSTYKDLRGFDFPKQIQDTISRLQGLYEGESTDGNAYLWVYCNEDSYWFKNCAASEASAIAAYEWESEFTHNFYITFCPRFFDPIYQASLSTIISDIDSGRRKSFFMESYYQGDQAHLFFHELFHMSQLVTSPRARDYAYGAKNVYDLARIRNTDAAVFNADSWALTAEAIWGQRRWNLRYPPVPMDYWRGTASNDSASLFKSSDSKADVVYADSENVVPQGAVPVANGEPFFVDTNLWEIYTPTKTGGISTTIPNTSINTSTSVPPSTTSNEVTPSTTDTSTAL